MAEENRGFRKFIHDPKNVVMNYIAENIPADRIAGGQGGPHANVQSSDPPAPNNPSPMNGGASFYPQASTNAPYLSPNLNQSTYPSNPNIPPHEVGFSQSQPFGAGTPAPVQHALDGSHASLSERMGNHVLHTLEHVPNPKLHQSSSAEHMMQLPQDGRTAAPNGLSYQIGHIGEILSEPGVRRRTSPQSVSRSYHRLVIQYETTKLAFFQARLDKSMADRSLASELESLSRRLWCLRRDNANGFESFSSSQNAFILTTLQTNHELWEDTVLDFEEGHSNSLNDVRPIQQSTTQDENDGGWMGGPSPVPGSFPQNNIALVPGGGRPQSQPIHTSNAMPQATFNQPMPVTQQLNHQAPNANVNQDPASSMTQQPPPSRNPAQGRGRPIRPQNNGSTQSSQARPAGPPPINGRISPNPMRPKTQQMRNTQSQPNVSQT